MPQDTPVSEEERRAADLEALIRMMQVEVAKDGGSLSLTSANYETGVVEVALGGACGTCSLTGTTLEVGVTRILTQRLDWVREVRGSVDESTPVSGLNGWRPR